MTPEQLRAIEERCSNATAEYSCVSEQGQVGILWTVFEGAPFSSRRIASFKDADDAREYLRIKQDFLALVQEVKRLREHFAKAGQSLRDENDKIIELRADNARLREALQELYDYQNGPPLIKWEDEWNAAMKKALAALATEKATASDPKTPPSPPDQ